MLRTASLRSFPYFRRPLNVTGAGAACFFIFITVFTVGGGDVFILNRIQTRDESFQFLNERQPFYSVAGMTPGVLIRNVFVLTPCGTTWTPLQVV